MDQTGRSTTDTDDTSNFTMYHLSISGLSISGLIKLTQLGFPSRFAEDLQLLAGPCPHHTLKVKNTVYGTSSMVHSHEMDILKTQDVWVNL